MSNPVDPKYLDKRTTERYVRTGKVDEKALEQHLASLPDLAERCAIVETSMLDEDLDDDFDDEDEEDDEELPEEGEQA